ncbi:DUF1631 family protein [Lysobacter solisilvae (ex Woo and Kim 2020)]|uniref:DUF1631 domain-containing protein n=1 Tax=Agrilutibacter terrestris TaxID=2865112 RepID=A0A7H0FUN5_9GAMM|nr:DUF1631 family protein [Lysobacter terrestris]QNP39751.1 DUF1631 domain-containing protein [Lysobacter terrestris]
MSVTFEHSVLHPTLASATLPRRVRRALEQVYNLAADEMARALERMLAEFEQQQFRLADQAANPGQQQAYFDTLRLVRQNRADLIPEFLSGLEAALAGIREPVPQQGKPAAPMHFGSLRLVEDHELDEEAVLRSIASRHESRTSLPLHLLGQRFGVLAGSPGFEADRLPVGPRQLGNILAKASRVLQIELQPRLELFRCFDQYALAGYAQLVEAMNAMLARENILPNLVYVPIRVRPALQSELTGEAGRERREQARAQAAAGGGGGGGGFGGGGGRARPFTGWFPGEEEQQENPENFNLLQDMLANRRDLLNKLTPGNTDAANRAQLSTDDVMQALARMQNVPRDAGEGRPRSVHDVRQALLAQSRQAQGHATALSREDNDAFELLAILMAEIQRELRQDAPGNRLVHKLVVPLLRLVLKDRGFFVHQNHPARQLLNTVAESGASWVGEDEVDAQLNDQLNHAVDDVVTHYEGDTNVFAAANQRVQQHLQVMARRAEVAERRHVDAARGKEKLELAKRRASEVIAGVSEEHKLPRFVQTLLSNSWSDVLTLVQLRNGEESEEWQHQLEVTTAIVRATSLNHPASPPDDLAAQIEHSLTLVGYHSDEAGDIARRLTANVDDDENDAASRTELAMRLKARGRLGQEANPDKPPLPPRSEREQAAYDMLRTLPFGAWFEFITNQQGDVVRRRLSWYSPMTDHALFVNQKGQRVGEQSLDSLARMLAGGQVRIVTVEHSSLVDRAWHSALGVLRGFMGAKQAAEAHDEASQQGEQA